MLGPEGLIIITSVLESFNCRKFLDIHFLMSVRQDIIYETSVVPCFNIQLDVIRVAKEIDAMARHDLPQG